MLSYPVSDAIARRNRGGHRIGVLDVPLAFLLADTQGKATQIPVGQQRSMGGSEQPVSLGFRNGGGTARASATRRTVSSRVTRSLARSVIDSDSGNTTSAGHCSRLMATVGERCSVAPSDSTGGRTAAITASRIRSRIELPDMALHPGELCAHL